MLAVSAPAKAQAGPGRKVASGRAAPRARVRKRNGETPPPAAILAIDIGGTSVKLLASGHHTPVKIPSPATRSEPVPPSFMGTMTSLPYITR